MAEVAAPTNKVVTVLNAVLDALIMGLGVEAAVLAATSQVPLLGLPIIKDLLRFAISKFADSLDTRIKVNLDNIIVRFQNDARKADYDKALEPLKKGTPTSEQIQTAKDNIDSIVRRSR